MGVTQTGHIDDTKTADTAAAPTGTIPTTFSQVIIQCEDNSIRWRADGTAPTTVIGQRMDPGDILILAGNDYADLMRRFSYINATAGSNGSLQFTFLTGYDRA
jgi:hypothetical protein